MKPLEVIKTLSRIFGGYTIILFFVVQQLVWVSQGFYDEFMPLQYMGIVWFLAGQWLGWYVLTYDYRRKLSNRNIHKVSKS